GDEAGEKVDADFDLDVEGLAAVGHGAGGLKVLDIRGRRDEGVSEGDFGDGEGVPVNICGELVGNDDLLSGGGGGGGVLEVDPIREEQTIDEVVGTTVPRRAAFVVGVEGVGSSDGLPRIALARGNWRIRRLATGAVAAVPSIAAPIAVFITFAR